MRSRVEERLVATLLPKRVSSEGEETSARFIIRGWLWASPLLLVALVIFFAGGMRFQALNILATAVCAVGVLASYRAGASLDVLRIGTLAILTVSFALGGLGQTPWDVSSLFFLTVVPLAAAFLGGFRWGVAWGLLALAAGVITVLLGQQGVSFPDTDPNPTLTVLINFALQIVLALVLARTWADERERALRKVQTADRAKSNFLANVSHEIRTPMNGILGMTELLLKSGLPAEQRGQLEVVQRSGHALVLLINDLLDLARLEEGRFELLVTPFQPRALLDDLVKLYAPTAHDRGLELRLTVDPALPEWLRGDGLRIRQVLSNLVANAVKFTPRGEVRLSAQWHADERVTFAVEDTGPGISAALRGKLFQRFEQGDASATRRTGGTGLGLALSHDFVARMGGTLALDEGHAPGARFAFTVPLPRELAPPPQAQTIELEGHTGRVLVVDDNPINLAVARGLLTRAGFEVGTAGDGRAAVALVAEQPWGLVLMDLQMPELDGLEATRLIRQLPAPAREVPIIALTASAMPQDLDACRAAGMNDVLAKPIDVRDLARVLHEWSRR